MRNEIYYLTRSYYPYQKGGGPLMRRGAVKYLQELGWDVTVIMPNFNSKELVREENITQIPFKRKHIQKLASLFERIGVYEDYLDKWVENAFEFLKNKIKKEDIVFATSGGELGTIKLGSLLKEKIGCKFVVNFRDPPVYSVVNGLKLDKKFHISREKQEYKYLQNSDMIITSSNSYKKSLKRKYPDFKIVNNYFGYVKKINLINNKKDNKVFKIAYVGNMGASQKPEILFDVYQRLSNKHNIEIYFVGNVKSNKVLSFIEDKNIKVIDFLPHDNFLEFMQNNIDVGFVSLTSDYLGACVPSKIYEYINLGLPILGALPDGDGKNIINYNNYGIACKYNDIDGLINAIEKLRNKNYLNYCRNNILQDREKWWMKKTIKEVDECLREAHAN